MPVEFGTLKRTNLEKIQTLLVEASDALRVADLTHRLKILTKMSEYLVTLTAAKIN
jgi:Fe-S cluster biosynthesis and repair protein YggX